MVQGISDPETWNKAGLLDRLGGDEALLQELVQIFAEHSFVLLQRLREAIAASDADAIMRGAHNIRGELNCLSAAASSQTAQQLEDMGHSKEISKAGEALAHLERDLVDLKRALTKSFVAHS